MLIDRVNKPHSSFLSVEKDMGIIANKLLQSDRLKRLLYYDTPDALTKPNLTSEQAEKLFGKNIKNIPKLYVDNSVLQYIIINFDNFTTNKNNPKFRDNIIEFDIICHFDQWNLNDYQLRPYRIAAEIDSLLDNQRLTGIGRLEFLGANQIILTDEYAGLCLMYQAIHGGEDKYKMPNPNDEAKFIEDYNHSFKE